MELNEDEEIQLEDFINKCRCCFRTIIDEQKAIEINKSVQEKFHNLTNLKVKRSEKLSAFNKIVPIFSAI
jgi:hypothetical protein